MPSKAEAREEITPLVRNDLSVPGTDMTFTAACFEGTDWSLGPLQRAEDAEDHPHLVHKIRSAMRHLGADRGFAPTPNPTEFNGEVILPERLERVINLGHKVLLFRNREVPADGTFLRSPRDAGVFSAGGCGMVIVAGGDLLLFAHAGRESLLDRTEIRTAGQERSRRRDLMSNLVETMQQRGVPSEKLFVWLMYFIKPDDFVHSTKDPNEAHAAYNCGALRYLPEQYGEAAGRVDAESIRIDLPRIARMQCLYLGVPARNISLDHAYLADELPHTRKPGGGRYLAAAVRHS
jgi:hypothetical protein